MNPHLKYANRKTEFGITLMIGVALCSVLFFFGAFSALVYYSMN